MCGWGPYTREASVLEACCWYSGVVKRCSKDGNNHESEAIRAIVWDDSLYLTHGTGRESALHCTQNTVRSLHMQTLRYSPRLLTAGGDIFSVLSCIFSLS